MGGGPDPYDGPKAFVGAQVREFRTAAGLTQKQLADAIPFATVSAAAMYERGERAASPEFLKAADEVLEAGGMLSRLAPLVAVHRFPTTFRPWLAIEREAIELYTYQLAVVHGLIQTEDYARALIGSTFSDRVDELVRARMERQSILDDKPAPLFTVVLDEGALWRPIGGPAVMAAQLEALIEANERHNITVQVVPSDVGAYPGLTSAFVIAVLPDGPDAAWMDSAAEGQVTNNPKEIAAIRRRFNAIRAEALPSRVSAEVMTKVMEQWKAQSSN